MGRLAAIPYYGGKHRLARHIVPIIEGIPHKVYVEPFAGGAGVFFQLEQVPPTTVLNDMNRCLMLLYSVMQQRSNDLQLVLDAIPFSRYAYQQAKFHIASCDVDTRCPSEQLMIAVNTYISLCMSFSNVMGDDGGWRVDKGRGSDPQTWMNRKARLKVVCDRLAHTYIDCADYASCIKRWDSPGTLFYIDPPYIGTDLGHYGSTAKSYTVEAFTENSLRSLCAQLDGIKGQYILSGYANTITPINSRAICLGETNKKLGTTGTKSDAEWLWVNF